MARDTVGKTILVATLLCIVCSLLVSAFAVGLRPLQKENKAEDVQKNILMAAGIFDPETPVARQFERVEPRIVDLRTGEYVEDGSVDPATFDQRKAAQAAATSVNLSADDDIAGIRRRSNYAFVYLIRDGEGNPETYVFPVHGYGLWSTMYGMLALKPDLETIEGLIFYDQKETPGLGGEVTNPRWEELWNGKIAFDDSGNPRIEVIKGHVPEDDPNKMFKVDGLTGATITSRGVTNLLQFWLGDQGFGPYIRNKKQGAAHG